MRPVMPSDWFKGGGGRGFCYRTRCLTFNTGNVGH